MVEMDSHDNIFPAANEMLKQLTNEEEIVSACQTGVDVAANSNNKYSKFHDYIRKGRIEDAIITCHSKFIDNLPNVETAATVQISNQLEWF